jgi:hypothetical protein
MRLVPRAALAFIKKLLRQHNRSHFQPISLPAALQALSKRVAAGSSGTLFDYFYTAPQCAQKYTTQFQAVSSCAW